MRIPIRNIGAGGIITDVPAFDLEPHQFTFGNNVVFRDGKARKVRGWAEKIEVDASLDAYWFHTWKDTTGSIYTVFGLDATIRIYDGTSISTPTFVALTAAAIDWQMDQFGKFPIINNGTDIPQYASTTDGSVWADLPDFGAALPSDAVKVVRAFKSFLIALYVGSDPYTLYWSDEAGPEDIPNDWDYSLTTNLAGRNPLPASDGHLVDGAQLGDSFIVYQDFAATAMRLVADTTYVFSFTRLFGHGLLNRYCMCPFESQHFCVGHQMIYIHDGSRIVRIADKKVEKQFFKEMVNQEKVYVTKDEINREILVYYATQQGDIEDTYPSRILRWNWVENVWSFEDVGADDDQVSCLAPSIRAVQSTTWDDLTTAGRSWDSLTETWSELSGIADDIPITHRLSIDVISGGSKFWETETTFQRDGADYDAYLLREYCDLDEVSGEVGGGIWYTTRIYPQITGAGIIQIRVGGTNSPGGSPDWSAPVAFDLDGDDYKVDIRVSGRYLFWEIGEWQGSPTTSSWEYSGMDVEAVRRGRR